MACERHAEAQEANGTAAEAQGCVPPLSIPTRRSGDLSDQSDAARLGQLLCGGQLRRVLRRNPRLGGAQGPAPYDACSETTGLRLEAVEEAVAAPKLEGIQRLQDFATAAT